MRENALRTTDNGQRATDITSFMTKRIGIIGGGILGMTLALRLSQRGFDVTILEACTKLGGLAMPMKIGDYTWDRFYHVIIGSDTALLDLIEELNLKEELRWKRTKTGFYVKGKLYSMSNAKEFLQFPPLSLIDKLRLGATIFYASKLKNWQRLEEILVAEWLQKLSGKRAFQKIWLPLLMAKLGDNYQITSASFIWAAICRMYGARNSTGKTEKLGYVAGGYQTVLNRFSERLDKRGIEVLTGNTVKEIKSNEGRVRVKLPGRTAEFDSVIVTLPSYQISESCPQLSAEEKSILDSVKYQGVVCAVVINQKPLADYYVTNITDDWVPFTGVIEMTALVDKGYFGGKSLIYLPRYLRPGDSGWGKGEREIKREFLGALERMYPHFNREQITAFECFKADGVHPLNTLRYSIELMPPTSTSVDGLYIVNSAQIPNGTMNVNEMVSLANRKAEELAALLMR